jgi:hypothetical protein
LEKCSTITKTYWLCQGVKFNMLAKFRFHRQLSPIINKDYRWSVNTLNDAQIWSQTIHWKRNCWTCNCIPYTNITSRVNYIFIGSQNDPTFHECAIQCPHIVLGEVLLILIHLFTLITKITFPFEPLNYMYNTVSFLGYQFHWNFTCLQMCSH